LWVVLYICTMSHNAIERKEQMTRYRLHVGHAELVPDEDGRWVEHQEAREEIDVLLEAAELLLTNWPESRDGMDFDPLPVGAKSLRAAVAKAREGRQ